MAVNPRTGTLPKLSYRDRPMGPAERRSFIRIVTWNCNAPTGLKGQEAASRRFRFYAALLKRLDADIVVLQAAPNPGSDHTVDHWTFFWNEWSPGPGIAVILDRHKFPWAEVRGVTRSAVLVQLGVPHDGNVLAIWSRPQRPSLQAYVQESKTTLALFEREILSAPTVVVGDFNSSAAWDRRTKKLSHSDLVAWLKKDLKLDSAYHDCLSVKPGREVEPTFYQHRQKRKPSHIDYCFVPCRWLVNDARVGTFEEWSPYSDHCPLIVDARPLPGTDPTVYIQADDQNRPYSHHGAAAARGFEALGYRIWYFRRQQLGHLSLNRGHVLVGGAGTTRAALERLGVPVPTPLNLPRQLEPYWGRAAWETTLGELEDEAFPVFVKPAENAKEFEGQVLRDAASLDRLYEPRPGFDTLSPNTRVQAQEVLKLTSEWRVFVLHGIIQGIWHYAGDPLIFPAASLVRMSIGAYTQGPAGYAADFAVTNAGQTILLEVNDGFSLGQGGIPAVKYARLLEARWHELTGRALS